MANSDEDIITFENNTTIKGLIRSFDAKGLQIEPDFSEDSVLVEYSKVRQVISFSDFFIHDKDEGYFGRFISVQEGVLLLEDENKQLRTVKSSEIYTGVLKSEYEKSFFTRLKYQFANWQSWIDFSLDVENGAVYKEKYLFGVYVQRRKAPTRMEFSADVAYDTQASSFDSNDTATTKNEAQGYLTLEYDTSKKQFGYITSSLMFDKVRGIEKRFFITSGFGHRFYDEKNVRFQVQIGVGQVFENFTDYKANEYTAVHIASSGMYRFENDINLIGKVFYMPDIRGAQKNWLGNYTLELAIPLISMVSFRLNIDTTFDSNPSPEVGNNKSRIVSGFRFDLM